MGVLPVASDLPIRSNMTHHFPDKFWFPSMISILCIALERAETHGHPHHTLLDPISIIRVLTNLA